MLEREIFMDKGKIEKLTNQQLTAVYSGRPPLATEATADQWSQLFEYITDQHSVAFAEWGREMVKNEDLMIRFYDLLMKEHQKDARQRGVHLGDKDISLLGVFDETDFLLLMKKARTSLAR